MVCQPHSPEIHISIRIETTAITGRGFKAIADVVIEPEISLSRVHIRQTILFRLILADLSGKQLLPASHDFGATHLLLPEWHLAQAVGGFDPVAAAVVRTSVLGAQIERNRGGLPRKMK